MKGDAIRNSFTTTEWSLLNTLGWETDFVKQDADRETSWSMSKELNQTLRL